MHIELDTAAMDRADALALATLIHNRFPDVLATTSGLFVLAGYGAQNFSDLTDEERGRMVAALQPAADEEPAEEPMDPATAFGAPIPLDPAVAFGNGGDVPLPPADAPVGAATPPPASVETDADGLPWDGRIHAGTKGKNADGRWKVKRKLDPRIQESVTAELRATMAAPLAATIPAPLAAPVASAETSPPASPEAGSATPASPPAADVSDPAAMFGTVMRKVTAAQTANKLTVAQVGEICAGLGIPGIPSLLTRPDLIPAFEAMLTGYTG